LIGQFDKIDNIYQDCTQNLEFKAIFEYFAAQRGQEITPI